MAITEPPRRKTTARKRLATLFSFTKTATSISSFTNRLPYSTRRKFSESMMEENIETAETMIPKWDISTPSYENSGSLFLENRSEARHFIKCVKDLRRAMDFLVTEDPTSSNLVRAQNLMQIAMRRLEREFYQILSVNNACLKPESVSSQSSRISTSQSFDSDYQGETGTDVEIQMVGRLVSEVENPALHAISDLRIIAECMISSGYIKECVNIFRIIRKSIIDEGLYNLGIEPYSSSQINRMTSDALEIHIKKWLNAVKIAVKALFQGEMFLCDTVFSISKAIRETCFTDIVKEGGISLFRFPELVARSKRSPEKVFRLMDLHDAIKDLRLDIELIFSYESVSDVKLQVLSSQQELGNSVHLILSEFETSIQKNSSKAPVFGGIHPLTNSVLDFTSSLANYSETLSKIDTDSVTPENFPFPESYFQSSNSDESPISAVSNRVAWIILVLLCKLDSKASLYNDTALSYLFLANNLQFIKEKVRASTLKHLLGDHWVAKLNRKVRLYAANYEAMAWTKALLCLPDNSLAEISPEMVKTHFLRFNASIEEAYRKQMSWVVPDVKLRNEIKRSIARNLVPAYREFYDAHFSILSGEKNLEVVVRFSPDILGDYLSDLFHGNAAVSGSSLPSRSREPRCLP